MQLYEYVAATTAGAITTHPTATNRLQTMEIDRSHQAMQ